MPNLVFARSRAAVLGVLFLLDAQGGLPQGQRRWPVAAARHIRRRLCAGGRAAPPGNPARLRRRPPFYDARSRSRARLQGGLSRRRVRLEAHMLGLATGATDMLDSISAVTLATHDMARAVR